MKNTMPLQDAILEKVKIFADQAHGEQKRKYSEERYIQHSIRVMETCQSYTHDYCMLAAALLHDVLEDTAVTSDALHDFLSGIMDPQDATRTLTLVVELTDIFTRKNYPHLNRRARKAKEADRLAHVSAEAQTIKYADIIDNATNIFVHDPGFAVVFIHEGKWLLNRMSKGDPELRGRALLMVNDCLELMEE
jgi:(p)ppGpp synthase/HD superfamily hydrolase